MSQEIRNIAIIAHVDHGKTTLTDGLMEFTGAREGDASMDNNALEQERGITIYAKNTSVEYKGTKIKYLHYLLRNLVTYKITNVNFYYFRIRRIYLN